MPWQKLKPQHQFGKTATLRKDGIALSGEFIQGENLLKYGWAELFIDSALHRIGFKFHDTQTGNTYKLSEESKAGRVLLTPLLQTYRWISDILDKPVSERRFLVETDESIEDPRAGVRYYLSIGYRFQPKRQFAKQGDYPRLAGVYRLFKNVELLRIGETDDLEGRLKQHAIRYKDRIDEYDFSEIEDTGARKLEEKRLLEEFKDAYGRLPKLNTITA